MAGATSAGDLLLLLLLLQTSAAPEGTPLLQANEGESATLRCSVVTPEFPLQFWLLMDRTVVVPGGIFNEYKYQISSYDGSLTVKYATVNDSGTYVCIAESRSKRIRDVHSSEVHLMVYRARAVQDRWQLEIKPNLIRGGIAAGGLAILFAIFCTVYKFRWKQTKRREQKESKISPEDSTDSLTSSNKGYSNVAAEFDENCIKRDSSSLRGTTLASQTREGTNY